MRRQGTTGSRAALLAACCALAAFSAPSGARAAGEDPAAETDRADAQPAENVGVERYYGRYGDADALDEIRGMFFVTEAKPPPFAEHFPDIPPGYIVISAAWADVAPYYMKPISETRFEQDFLSDFDPEAAVVDFELDDQGRAVALTFKTVLDEFGRRVRLGDVPEEYR